MNPWILVPVVVGVSVVLQGGLNRQLAGQWGLSAALFFNSISFLAGAALLLLWVKMRPETVPELLRIPADPGSAMQWRGVATGLLGVFIVVGLPWAIAEFGALRSILVVLVAQIAASMIWDAMVEGIAVSPLRALGAVIALGGAWLASTRS
jgi:uncharacterized membrane protein YdcZ (DUF606 family)